MKNVEMQPCENSHYSINCTYGTYVFTYVRMYNACSVYVSLLLSVVLVFRESSSLQNYRSPLLAVADSSHPILEDKNVRTIFYGVEELQELHSKLYKQFEARAQNWSSDVCVGDLFIELVRSVHGVHI